MADNKRVMQILFMNVEGVRKNWAWFFALGLLLILFGGVLISSATLTTVFSVIFFGIFLAAAGIVQIVQAFLAPKWSGLFLSLLLGILYIATGAICLVKPEQAAISLTLLIGLLCFIAGIGRMVASCMMQYEHWGWVFFNGLVTFILGLLILSEWPVSGLWVIGLFVGVDMVLLGWSWLLLSLAARPD